MVRFVVTGAAALAFVGAPTVLCYNGVMPWAPFVPSCTLPGPQNGRVRGAAPDANAIIACRNHPGCLSWYVNGP
jgi:hypothetical protein